MPHQEFIEISTHPLELFLDVAESGNFSAAARKRGNRPAWAQEYIAAIEDRLGFKLVEPETKPVLLTEAGQRFLYHLKGLLAEAGWEPGETTNVRLGPMEQFRRPDPGGKRIIPEFDKTWSKRNVPPPPKRELPDGEFYTFVDTHAPAATPLSAKGLYDPDPAETEAIKARRAAYYATLEPYWKFVPYEPFHYEHPEMAPMPADLVHRRSAFKRPMPKKEPEHILAFPFWDYATSPPFGDYYTLVSPQWKAAMEALEPGLHEFFPHEVVFNDGSWDRFVLRSCQNVNFLVGLVPFWSDLKTGREKAYAKRSALAGRHWVRHWALGENFASRELAVRLRPLLPPRYEFYPLTMVD